MRKFYFITVLFLLVNCMYGQSTYQTVYNILQTNCTGTCHTSSNPCNLILTGTPDQVYAAIVSVNPVNSAALAAGYKLVDPGQPRNSFLFAKINQGLDANLALGANQGTAMPDSNTSMSQYQREMVRQWILFAAKDTGTFASDSTIIHYYINQGGFPKQVALPPPPAGEGVQLHFGPLFIEPGVEIQYGINSYLKNNGYIDVTRMQSEDNPESHHFAIWQFYPGHDTTFPVGMIPETTLSDFAALYYNAPLVGQYPKNIDIVMPEGCGLLWNNQQVINLSFHMINYTDSILAGEAWLNIYYSPHSPSTIQVIAAPVVYGGDNPTILSIPNDSVDHTDTIVQFSPDSNFYYNILSIQAHTHKLGVNYNVWQRNADGTKGALIYNGQYSPNYAYDQHVYVWNDPPFEQFSPLLPVNMTTGLIHEATYNNSGPATVNFGLTTQDEMFITFMMYIKSEFPLSVGDKIYADDNLKEFPNPVAGTAHIAVNSNIPLQNGELQVYDLLGNKVADETGINEQRFDLNMNRLPSGCYVYKLINNGSTSGTGKIVVQH